MARLVCTLPLGLCGIRNDITMSHRNTVVQVGLQLQRTTDRDMCSIFCQLSVSYAANIASCPFFVVKRIYTATTALHTEPNSPPSPCAAPVYPTPTPPIPSTLAPNTPTPTIPTPITPNLTTRTFSAPSLLPPPSQHPPTPRSFPILSPPGPHPQPHYNHHPPHPSLN